MARHSLAASLVWGLGLLPLVALVHDFARDRLGADPVEDITHRTGAWALRMLLLCLAVTPLRRWTGWGRLAPHRRTLGLLAFVYAALHLATYVALDLGFHWPELAEDVLERPYITVGFTSFLILLVLALTSTRHWQKRLGTKWRRLHAGVYLAASGGVLHFLWLVKADLRDPLLHACVLVLLLGFRFVHRMRTRARRKDREYATLPRPFSAQPRDPR